MILIKNKDVDTDTPDLIASVENTYVHLFGIKLLKEKGIDPHSVRHVYKVSWYDVVSSVYKV